MNRRDGRAVTRLRSVALVLRWTLAMMCGASVVLGIAAIRRDTESRSPERAAPVLHAPVERGTLSDTVNLPVKLVPGFEMDVAAPRLQPSDLSVITAAPKPTGSVVNTGDVLVNVAERAVVVLPGQVPAFRSLTIGTEGVDVEQLQRALGGLGYGLGRDRLGVAGPGTWRAMRAFLKSRKATATDANGSVLAHNEPDDRLGLPLGSIVFVRQLPATVVSGCTLGLTIAQQGTVCGLSGGTPRLTGTIPMHEAERVVVGLSANVMFAGEPPLSAKVSAITDPTSPNSDASSAGGSQSTGSRNQNQAGASSSGQSRAPTGGSQTKEVSLALDAPLGAARADQT